MPKFTDPINLTKLEIQNFRWQNLASDPSSPVIGQGYYNTADNAHKGYNGTEFRSFYNDDDDFHVRLSLETTTSDSDEILIYDASAGIYRRMTKSSFIAGTGGEANTGSNQGVDGVGVFDVKSGVDLQFRNIASASNKVTVVLNGKDIDIDIDPSKIAHSTLNDDEATKHRIINDSGTSTTELWSANKINSGLSGKENADVTILKQADVDDTPVNGVTTAPISSNWAYDHVTTSNPHNTTKSDIGLGNVTNDAQIPLSQKGANSGVAELDSSGVVPSSQLPSFVDDVVEATDFANLPGTGETGKIYVTLDDNKTYRWSGSAYIEISTSLALGETSSTAYRGDRGKTAYDHSQSAHAPSDAIQASGVTFENLNTNGDIGTGSNQVAVGNHTHAGALTRSEFTIGDGTNNSFVITHNKNTRSVTVNIYETATPYEDIYTKVERTSVDTITVSFGIIPTNNQYTVVII